MTDRAALEELWRTRLKDAKLRLDFARQYLKEVQRDLNNADIPAADGNFALAKAITGESAAIKEYNRILAIFTELVAHGVVPDED